MINKLLLFFVALPLVELCLMLLLSQYLGIGWTLLFIIGTGILGTWLANTQGLSTYRKIQQEIAQGRMPTDALIDGVLILLAGVLLITPGVLTDLTGILLMLPPTRRLFRLWLIAWFKRNFKIQSLVTSTRTGDDGNVVDSFATQSPSEPVEQSRRLD